MPKNKSPRKSTSVDMTAMTDVAFLLLTFFMLATKFKPDEPVVVDTPSSISEIKLPESNVMLLTISADGRVFFSLDKQQDRLAMLDKMSEKYPELKTLNANERKEFSNTNSFGVPVSRVKQLMNAKPEEKAKLETGIPSDSLKNELADWIWQARLSNNDLRVAIKGDRETNYPVVKQVLSTLQEKKVNRFNFITTMEKAAE